MLIAVIGIASLMASRVQRRSTTLAGDAIVARELARSGIDLGLLYIQQQPTQWRADFAAGTAITNMDLGDGQVTVTAADPIDGNLTNNSTDPVVLTGVGNSSSSTYMLEVTLNGDGTIQPGTWKRVVN